MKDRVRILLVEDDDNDEIMTLRMLQKANLNTELIVVRDGAEALDYLFRTGSYATRDCGRMPERILLDLNLPILTGLEVLQRIKSDGRTKGIPVTMLTGSDHEIIVAEVLRHGAEACVLKPLSCEMLRQIVGQRMPPSQEGS